MATSPNTLLDLDLLRTFVAISEAGSFTSAAAVVLRTPSAISMQIKRLEELVGRQLFLRQGRSVSLTADGEVLLGFGRQMLLLNEQALIKFQGEQLEGCIRFGAPDDFGTRFLPNILKRFASSHPNVEVNVSLGPSSGLLSKLDEGSLDLTLVTTGMQRGGKLCGRLVFSEPLVWVGVSNGRAVSCETLPLALAGNDCAWRTMALDALSNANRAYRIAYTCENCQGQLAALLADLAIAPLPQGLLSAEYEILGREQGLPRLEHYEIRLCENHDLGPAGKAFSLHVIDSFADMSL